MIKTVIMSLFLMLVSCGPECDFEYECTDEQDFAAREYAKDCYLRTIGSVDYCLYVGKRIECKSREVCK